MEKETEKESETTAESHEDSLGIRANSDFSNYLEIVDIREILGTRVKGEFFLIRYENDNNIEKDFLEFILDRITDYALKKNERDIIAEKRTEIAKTFRLAISRFVENPTGGEFGEIILFHLLEVYEGAVQIINKMPLKTSGKMYVHGADALHFKIDKDGLKTFYFGESKTGPSFSKVLLESLSTVKGHKKESTYDYDVELASGNISEDIPKATRELIKAYLSSSGALIDKKSVHAIFLGYQYDKLKKYEDEKLEGKELVKTVTESYRNEINEYLKQIETKIKADSEISNDRFLFFIIPFKDIDGAKNKFMGAIKHGRAFHI